MTTTRVPPLQVPQETQDALFAKFASRIIDLEVTHAWSGIGSAIFLEFGKLATRLRRDGSTANPDGEMGLMVEWDWRVEGRRMILCGSSSEERLWGRGCRFIHGQRVTSVSRVGRLFEIDLAFSNGVHLVSFAAVEGSPQWTLFDRRNGDTSSLFVQRGYLYLEVGRPTPNS